MGFEYKSKGHSELTDLETLNKIQSEGQYLIPIIDRSIIAKGFGQINITDEINTDLKSTYFHSFK